LTVTVTFARPSERRSRALAPAEGAAELEQILD